MGRGTDGPCALRDARVRYRSGPDGQRTFLSDKEGTKGPRSLRSSDRRSLRASRCFCSSSCRAFFGDCPRLPVFGSGRPLERMGARRFDPVGAASNAFLSDRTVVTPTTVGKAGAWAASSLFCRFVNGARSALCRAAVSRWLRAPDGTFGREPKRHEGPKLASLGPSWRFFGGGTR